MTDRYHELMDRGGRELQFSDKEWKVILDCTKGSHTATADIDKLPGLIYTTREYGLLCVSRKVSGAHLKQRLLILSPLGRFALADRIDRLYSKHKGVCQLEPGPLPTRMPIHS